MVKIKVNTSEFDKTFREYLRYNKRTIPEIVTTKAFFIARNAVNETASTSADTISSGLLVASRVNPRAPLAAILVNKQRRQGKGLNGALMAEAVEKFVKKRQATRNFLRAGWLQAVKKMAPFVKSKRGQKPIPTGIRARMGLSLGGARAAKPISNYWKATASIWNSVLAGKKKKNLNTKSSPAKVQQLI